MISRNAQETHIKWAELWFIKELKSPLGMATSCSNRQCYWLLLPAAQIASSTGVFHQKAVPPPAKLLHVAWELQTPTLNSPVKLASPSLVQHAIEDGDTSASCRVDDEITIPSCDLHGLYVKKSTMQGLL